MPIESFVGERHWKGKIATQRDERRWCLMRVSENAEQFYFSNQRCRIFRCCDYEGGSGNAGGNDGWLGVVFTVGVSII